MGDDTLLSGEMNGNKLSEQTVKAASLTIDGEKHITQIGDDTITGTLRLDPTKNPKAIDVAHSAGVEHKGKTGMGIYKLEKGVFAICFAPPGNDRQNSQPNLGPEKSSTFGKRNNDIKMQRSALRKIDSESASTTRKEKPCRSELQEKLRNCLR